MSCKQKVFIVTENYVGTKTLSELLAELLYSAYMRKIKGNNN